MAATLTTHEVFDAFLGEYDEFKTFFHGHSYTANQLGAAAALASLEILQTPNSSAAAHAVWNKLCGDGLESLWSLPNVGDIRQVGLVAGIELVATGGPASRSICASAPAFASAKPWRARRAHPPVGNVVVLMPPYCTTPAQLKRMLAVMREAIAVTLGRHPKNIERTGQGA